MSTNNTIDHTLEESSYLKQHSEDRADYAFPLSFQIRRNKRSTKESLWKKALCLVRGHGLYFYSDLNNLNKCSIFEISLNWCTFEDCSKEKINRIFKLNHLGKSNILLSIYCKVDEEDELRVKKLCSQRPLRSIVPSKSSDFSSEKNFFLKKKDRLFHLKKRVTPISDLDFKIIKQPTKTFGVSLTEYLSSRPNGILIPIIVTKIIEELNRRGLQLEGIYRQSGFVSVRNELKSEFDNNELEVDLTEEKWHNTHSIAATLKMYFRELPESLFTDSLVHVFSSLQTLDDSDALLVCLYLIKYVLPQENYNTLQYLLNHLNDIVEEPKNLMGSAQLAICWAPSLFGVDQFPIASGCFVVQLLLENLKTFFESSLASEEIKRILKLLQSTGIDVSSFPVFGEEKKNSAENSSTSFSKEENESSNSFTFESSDPQNSLKFSPHGDFPEIHKKYFLQGRSKSLPANKNSIKLLINADKKFFNKSSKSEHFDKPNLVACKKSNESVQESSRSFVMSKNPVKNSVERLETPLSDIASFSDSILLERIRSTTVPTGAGSAWNNNNNKASSLSSASLVGKKTFQPITLAESTNDLRKKLSELHIKKGTSFSADHEDEVNENKKMEYFSHSISSSSEYKVMAELLDQEVAVLDEEINQLMHLL
ncbi:rho GTPase-activating protein 21-like isoform X1 [Zophobas morio]|uniref:rho GTPase-activating protein 21-like isoform X1 n=1 Tax=Zophobas morio TaxID=2755281 RepID=UPI0030836330